MFITFFKHVYFDLHIGNMCHFYELKNVSWLVCAWKFTALSQM